MLDARGNHDARVLSTDLLAGAPTTTVGAGSWQAARLVPGAAWAFGGCTVAPGFEYADFEMPPAEELLAAYPDQAELIRRLTR